MEEGGEKRCPVFTAFTGAAGSSRVGTGKSVNPVGIPPTQRLQRLQKAHRGGLSWHNISLNPYHSFMEKSYFTHVRTSLVVPTTMTEIVVRSKPSTLNILELRFLTTNWRIPDMNGFHTIRPQINQSTLNMKVIFNAPRRWSSYSMSWIVYTGCYVNVELAIHFRL